MPNITTHVTSLELSRRLKELGVPQKSNYTWQLTTRGYQLKQYDYATVPSNEGDDRYSAYLASELGEMLPSEVTETNKNTAVFGEKAKSKYIGIDFFEDQVNDSYGMERVWKTSVGSIQFREKTEADARAKMLIYLIENHLISVEELGK